MRALLIVACMSAAFAASGQERPDYTLLGAGIRSKPEYLGSNAREAEVVPVVRYYGETLFARTTHGVLEGGARWALARGLEGGVQLAWEEGPLDDDAGASLGAHLKWDGQLGPSPVSLLGRLRQNLNTDHGLQFDTRATAGVFAAGGFGVAAFAQATWANARSTLAYYGLRESGLLYWSLGLQGGYELGRNWLIVGSVESRRLSEDVARSALVQRRTAGYASAGLAYRFRP
jgi:outer membrane scaffolding protein for murein synthesis (MipA/OmpV family)